MIVSPPPSSSTSLKTLNSDIVHEDEVMLERKYRASLLLCFFGVLVTLAVGSTLCTQCQRTTIDSMVGYLGYIFSITGIFLVLTTKPFSGRLLTLLTTIGILTLPILMFLESQLGSNCWPCRFAWAFILASFLIDRGTKFTTKFLAGILAVSVYAAPFILGIVPEYSAKISSLTQSIVLEEQFFGPKVGKSLDNSNELIRDGQFVIWTNCQVCNYQKRLEDVTTRKLVNPNVMILSLSKDKYDHDLPKDAYIVPEFVFDDLEVSIHNPPVYIETNSSRVEKVEKL